MAYAGTKMIVSMAFQTGGPNNYVPLEAAPSWPILLFTLVVSMLTGVVFGIAPAWMTSHADPADALRGAGRSVGAGRSWTQKSLVIAQIAVSVVLLSAAALLSKSLRNLEHQKFGFETRDRYIAWINPTLGNYKLEQMEPMFRQIDDRLLQIPGMRMVAPALYAPMTGDSWNDSDSHRRQAGARRQRRHRAPGLCASCRPSSKPSAPRSCWAGPSPKGTPRRRAR